MELKRDDYTLFDTNEFQEIIGDSLANRLQDREENDFSSYFITYVSQLIINCIREHTSLELYKEYDIANPSDYRAYLGLARLPQSDGTRKIIYQVELTEDQINSLKLACIYEADYLIDNGSTERMTAMGMVNRSNKYDKKDLKEFEICSMSYGLLSRAGLLYQGLGGGVYARVK